MAFHSLQLSNLKFKLSYLWLVRTSSSEYRIPFDMTLVFSHGFLIMWHEKLSKPLPQGLVYFSKKWLFQDQNLDASDVYGSKDRGIMHMCVCIYKSTLGVIPYYFQFRFIVFN